MGGRAVAGRGCKFPTLQSNSLVKSAPDAPLLLLLISYELPRKNNPCDNLKKTGYEQSKGEQSKGLDASFPRPSEI